MEELLLDNCGCLVTVAYEYHPYTQDLIDAYTLAGMPQPEKIYRAWDAYTRNIIARTTDTVWLTITGTGTYDNDGNEIPETEYLVTELAGALKIIDVAIEGQGINETDTGVININTTTGLVQFGITLTVGAKVKFIFNK